MFRNSILYIVIIISLVLTSYAVSSEKWSKINFDGNNYMSMGLWKACTKTGNSTNCEKLPPKNNKSFNSTSLYIVRAMSILNIIVLVFILLIMKTKHSGSVVLLLVLILISFILSLGSVIIWLAEFTKIKIASGGTLDLKLSSSAYVQIVSYILTLAGLIYVYINKAKWNIT